MELSVPADVPAGQYQLRTMADINGMTTMVLVVDRDPATVGPTVWVGMEPPASTPATDAPSTTPVDNAAVTVVAVGSTGQVPLVVSNAQKRAVRRTYNVSFYLSDDPTLSHGDHKFSRQQVTTRVGAGRTEAMMASFQLPEGVRLGTHYLIAVADPVKGAAAGTGSAKALRTVDGKPGHAGQVRLVVPIVVARPRLEASVQSVKEAPKHSGMARVTVRVTNAGEAGFAGGVTLSLWSDADVSEALLTKTRRLHLEAGEYTDVTLRVRRPDASGGLRVRVS